MMANRRVDDGEWADVVTTYERPLPEVVGLVPSPSTGTPVRVAMIGLRGIPARYGGVETIVEGISAELVRHDHRVTVYCWRKTGEVRPRRHRGVDLVYLPTINASAVGALVHAVLATLHACRSKHDVIHYHALGPGLAAPLARLLCPGAKVVLTVHGRDDQRAKWSTPVRTVLKFAHWLSTRAPDETLVVSKELAQDYHSAGRTTRVVPNAIQPVPAPKSDDVLRDLDLLGRRYVVSIGRLVPEKAAHQLVRSFAAVEDPEMRLVLVGESSATDDYVSMVSELASHDPRVMLTGARYGDELAQLLHGSAMFVTASELEGLPTALLEAVLAQRPVVASDIGPHIEILGDDRSGHRLVRLGDDADLTSAITHMAANPPCPSDLRALASDVHARFSFDRARQVHEQAYRA